VASSAKASKDAVSGLFTRSAAEPTDNHIEVLIGIDTPNTLERRPHWLWQQSMMLWRSITKAWCLGCAPVSQSLRPARQMMKAHLDTKDSCFDLTSLQAPFGGDWQAT